MRILLCFSGQLFESRGTPIRVLNILNGLVNNGAEVFYAGYDHPKNILPKNFLPLSVAIKRPFSLIKFIRENKVGIFYVQTSAGLWLAPFVKLFTKAKCGLDFHSLRIEEEVVYNKLGFFSYTFLKYLELFLCIFLDFATGASSKLKQYYSRVITNFYVLPVGADLKLFCEKITPNEEVMIWKAGSVLMGYAGSIKEYQGTDAILSVFSRINKEKPGFYKLLVVGSSSTKELRDYIAKFDLTGVVKILDKQPHEKIPSLLAAADILTIVRPSNMITEYAFPSKFSEYVALGKALIVSRVSDIEYYVENNKSAIIIKPGDLNGFYQALINLEDPALRIKLGREAEKVAGEKLDIESLNKKLFEYLKSI